MITLAACESDDNATSPALTQKEIVQMIEEANAFLTNADQYTITTSESGMVESLDIRAKKHSFLITSGSKDRIVMFWYEEGTDLYDYEEYDMNDDGVIAHYHKKIIADSDLYWENKRHFELINSPSKYTWSAYRPRLSARGDGLSHSTRSSGYRTYILCPVLTLLYL